MPHASASLAFLLLCVVAQGQHTRIIWPENKQQDTDKFQKQESFDIHLDDDGMEVVEVYEGQLNSVTTPATFEQELIWLASKNASTDPTKFAAQTDELDVNRLSSSSSTATLSSGTHKASSTRLDNSLSNDQDDEQTDEMDDLLDRLGKFRKRAEKAQTSKSEEAIHARFFAGLDDDDEEDEQDGVKAIELSSSALIELLQTGKLPSNIQDLFETGPSSAGLEVPVDTPVPQKERVQKDPPAKITTYHDQVEAARGKDHGNPIVLLSRFNFHNNVMTRRDDEVENWVIRFCHEWYSPCERLLPAYKTMAHEMEEHLNKDSMKTVVRFAEVDCSTDKPLCNDQGAETFPKLIHYRLGNQIGQWEGASRKGADVKEMNAWMQAQSKKILQQRSSGAKPASEEKVKSLLGTTWDPSWLFSLVTMFATLLGHVWLVRARAHGTSKAMPTGHREDRQKHDSPTSQSMKRVTLGPSGLGSMLPEEWVSNQSRKEIIEL